MQTFTGWQYLLIDLANHFGLDKLLFEERIRWAESNLHQLEALMDSADNKPLYFKTVLAIRRALRGEPIGHLVGLDACCSGIQIMSALTGCVVGARNTGLVDPNVRADAYSKLTETMIDILNYTGKDVERNKAKEALMTVFYGSKAKPKEIFGEDTPELDAFYKAAPMIAPGAWELLQDLLSSWQPYALEHRWQLPDGFEARVKVMDKKETRIEVDELNHATFTYEYYENRGQKEGLANVANVVHSVDAYILRCIHRRCNYDRGVVENALAMIQQELQYVRGGAQTTGVLPGTKLAYYEQQYVRSGMADIVILPYIDQGNIGQLSGQHLVELEKICLSMTAHRPFEVVTVHDEFKCHPNNMNYQRQHYINVFAELAESNLLSDILSQIHGKQGTFRKLSNNLGQLIRGSNYALS